MTGANEQQNLTGANERVKYVVLRLNQRIKKQNIVQENVQVLDNQNLIKVKERVGYVVLRLNHSMKIQNIVLTNVKVLAQLK